MQCPRCHRYLPDGYRFCPHDGSETVDRIPPASMRAGPTGMGGRRLADRYLVRGFVGKGAMARVYLAEDERTGKPVAIKVLEEPWCNDATVRERFQREAQTASVIGHPSIVEVYATGEREEDAAPFLVMEFLVGEPLGDYLRRERRMPRDLALGALEQAASALAAAHRVGIVHRDVKPDNLFLIGEPGDPYELKVVDFGLSRTPQSKLTAAGMIMGTPATMAPEQVVGEEVDARTDIYALGMVAYLALSGRLPFQQDRDEVATLAHHVWTPPLPLSKAASDIEPALERVVMSAIQKQPANRLASMDAFAAELAKIARGEPDDAPAPPDDSPYKPATLIGTLMRASMGRAIGREDDS